MGRAFEQIWNFFSSDTDYFYEKTTNIFDKYYNEKQNNNEENDEKIIKFLDEYDS